MKNMDGFNKGVNLGGWLSQFKKFDHGHFKTFITKEDIRQIADWGMDHVRIPIDYSVIEYDEKPYIYQESGFEYIDNCLDWCRTYALNVVLDLHRAPGYIFDAAAGTNTLFTDRDNQSRLISLWETIIKRYADGNERKIIFELLNEIVLPDSGPWNALSHKIHEAIRAINKDALIMIGGNEWNSVETLKEIDLFPDPNVFYTFHFYEPLPFTHQKAYWTDDLKFFNKELAYPGPIEGLDIYLDQYPQFRQRLGRYAGIFMNETGLRKELRPAIDFMKQADKQLYCGEFGVIDRAPGESTLKWYKDILKLFKENNIGYSCWTYKLMDFGLVDQESRIIDKELADLICN